MALPRSHYVQDGQEGVYHCFSRCVRRAFLYGFDPVTQRDFSHRKAWIVSRLRHLAAIFAIDVCAYAILDNHYHTILRTRPDLVALWCDRDVAIRWLTLFPRHRDQDGVPMPPVEKEIRAVTDCPERITTLRQRLSSLSWFMGRLNEFIARAANQEDGVKGRFWESRFKCQALLDEAALAAAMVYVDLNPIRAGRAASPEDSDFTSIQERIRAWQKESTAATVPRQAAQDPEPVSLGREMVSDADISHPDPDLTSVMGDALAGAAHSASWLCPIQSDCGRRGILAMSAEEYFDLVDRTGRIVRSDKRGAMEPDLVPILLRIGANPEAWLDTVTRFGTRFHLAAGMLSSLRGFAHQLGRRWFTGVTAVRAAFAASTPQWA
jgi:REP element-mobilizing transposase RayT